MRLGEIGQGISWEPMQVERFVLELGGDVRLCDTAGAQTDSLFALAKLSGIDTMSSSATHQCGAGGHQLRTAMPGTGATSDVTSGGTTEDDTDSTSGPAMADEGLCNHSELRTYKARRQQHPGS